MSLDVGDVFRLRDLSISYEPHRFVVVHKIDDDSILTITFSSQLPKVKAWCRRDEIDPPIGGDPRTYIEVSVSDCPQGLTKDSALNCNRVDPRSIRKCEADFDFNNFGGAKLPASIIQMIRDAIPHSRTVDDDIKDYFK